MELEEIRQLGETLDAELIRLLTVRIKYPSNLELYETRNHPILQRDSCLFSYIKRFYSQILRVLCKEGISEGDLEKVIRLDREIALKIIGRTVKIGEAAAEYKHPRGLPTYIPVVEERKIKQRIQQAEEENLAIGPEQIISVFNLIFRETKRIEDIATKSEKRVANHGLRRVKTESENLVEGIRRELVYEGERLGGKHSVGVSKEGSKYIITLY